MQQDKYKCPECDWVGTEDEMENNYEEYWDGEEESFTGAMCNCPKCYFKFSLYGAYGSLRKYSVEYQ